MPPPICYAERPPPLGLASAVRDLWSFSASADVPAGLFTLPPDPCLSLAVVALGPRLGPRLGLRMVGPHLRPLDVPIGPGAQVRGVRFRPEAAGGVLGVDVSRWVDRNAAADLPDLANAVASCNDVDAGWDVLLARLIDWVARAGAPDSVVARAVATIEDGGGEQRITGLAGDLGVSVRTLQRRFRAATGLSPKTFSRVRRFLQAARNVLREEPDAWGRVAAECGFADQAHFARECTALTGLSPTAFAERMAPILHVGVRP